MSRTDCHFKDRRDAGRQLATGLMKYRDQNPLILALPRGGVPVAFEIAERLQAELDVLFVRKIGAPGHPEYGIGAVVDGAHPQTVLNEEIVRQLAVSPAYIQDQTARELREIERRRAVYQGGRAPAEIAGRTVIMVDDGIATGGTVRAALQGLKLGKPARLVLAVPVAPPEAIDALRSEADEIVCLATPDPFYAVGLHYDDFRQTEDEEVVRLLADAASWRHDRQPQRRV